MIRLWSGVGVVDLPALPLARSNANSSYNQLITTAVLNVGLGLTRWPNHQHEKVPNQLRRKGAAPSAKSLPQSRYDPSTYASNPGLNATL